MKKQFYVTIFLFFLALFGLFSSGHFGGDGLDNFLVAGSIVEDGDLSIHDKPFDVKELRYKVRGRKGIDGKRYSTHGMGMPLILVPSYALGAFVSNFLKGIPRDYITQFFASFTNSFICSALALVLIMVLRELKFSMRTAFLTALIFSLCTMNFVYSRSSFSEPLIALCFLLSSFFILRYSVTGRLVYIFFCGLCFGYGVFVKTNYLLYAPCFVLTFIFCGNYIQKSFRKTMSLILTFAIPMTLFIMLILLVNHMRFGGILNTEYGSASDILALSATGKKYFKGIFYFLFSSGKGYFFFNIPFVLSFFGIKNIFKRDKMFSFFILLMLLLNFSFWVYIFNRGSLFSWGPRYLFQTMPFMAVFLAYFIDNAKNLSKKIVLVVTAALGFIVQLPGSLINYSRWIFFLKEQLAIEEYMINYVPDISPIKGAWHLLFSSINNIIYGGSLMFTFDPDYRFIQQKSASMAGYDFLDIWWAHLSGTNPEFKTLIMFVCTGLIVVSCLSLARILRNIKESEISVEL